MNNKDYYIKGVRLTDEHIGSKVIYVPRHAKGNIIHPDCEGGTIMRWNDAGVFVDYIRNKRMTNYEDLIWG